VFAVFVCVEDKARLGGGCVTQIVFFDEIADHPI
jgi:hypothetical protein